MMPKKKILFVMNNLGVGGAEKALVSMLQVFDYTSYEVDLLLFKQEGLFMKQIPPEVNLLPEPENWKYFDMPFSQVFVENFFKGKWNVIIHRIMFKLVQVKAKNASEREQFGWKPLAETLKILPETYDVAIGFLQKNPNYFVVDKVNAEKKIGYIHNDYLKLGMNVDFDISYFQQLTNIVTVSDNCLRTLKETFPKFASKFVVIENIISAKIIKELADKYVLLPRGFNIVSVGRLTYQKGYDLAYEAMKEIIKENKKINWIILGEGEMRKALERQIADDQLQSNIFLPGVVENPYSYIANADLFLHSARFEGYGIVVTEAKIINKPIILTNFNTASSLIKNGFNGRVTKIAVKSIKEGLDGLINDENLRDLMSENLSKETWGTEQEIIKLYQLIEN